MALDSFIGEIKAVCFSYAPKGWALCDGKVMNIRQNAPLFSILGSNYGGDGTLTFALPDLRGRTTIGYSLGHNLGYLRGHETNTLSLDQMPVHTHKSTYDNTGGSTTDSPKLKVGNDGTECIDATVSSYINGDMSGLGTKIYRANSTTFTELDCISGDMSGFDNDKLKIASTGDGQSIDNMQPCLAINYIICIQGLYPSRP